MHLLANLLHILRLNFKPSNTSAKISYLNQCQTIKRLITSISRWVSTYTKFSLLLKHIQHLQLYWKIINWSINSEYSKYAEALLIIFAEFHCCLVVPSVKKILGRLCESINSHERCRMRIMLYYAATAYMSTEKKIIQNFLG
jgi:hypothetical protein